jgi:hypothetical protein
MQEQPHTRLCQLQHVAMVCQHTAAQLGAVKKLHWGNEVVARSTQLHMHATAARIAR